MYIIYYIYMDPRPDLGVYGDVNCILLMIEGLSAGQSWLPS